MFKNLIKEISPLLKQIDFIKKGNNFYKISGKNYGIINFQKSKYSTKEAVIFTLNFGIYSSFLGQSIDGYKELTQPDIEQCQWKARIGDFMSGSPDYWWNFQISDNLNRIISNVIENIQSIIVPELNKRISDNDLIFCWMNENYAGTTEIGRFKYLTALLKEKEDFNTLNQIIESFMQQSKGKPNSIRALEHLKDINYNK